MTERPGLELSALDGANPLGYLAALGTLVTLQAVGERGARLGWVRRTTWVPILHGLSTAEPEEFGRVLASGLGARAVAPDVDTRRRAAQKKWQAASKALADHLSSIKARKLKGAERTAALEQEIRPLELERDRLRQEWLSALAEAAPRPELALGDQLNLTGEEFRQHAQTFQAMATHCDRESIDLLAAFGTDACLKERSNLIEPTPFCFVTGSGHQYFLKTVGDLLEQVSAERVRRALFEPWDYSDEKLSLRWDPIEDRRYALMDRDPTASGNKATTVWMANLLGYRALALFPSAPSARGLATTGWSRIEGDLIFTWPIWESPASLETVRGLLQLQGVTSSPPDRAGLRARGVTALFSARRIKVGSGANFKVNFSQARAV